MKKKIEKEGKEKKIKLLNYRKDSRTVTSKARFDQKKPIMCDKLLFRNFAFITKLTTGKKSSQFLPQVFTVFTSIAAFKSKLIDRSLSSLMEPSIGRRHFEQSLA